MRPLPRSLVPVAATVASSQMLAIPPPAAPAPSTASPLPQCSLESGKDIAAAYAHSKSSNPLTRAKDRS
jgi:hypothetical protein